MTATVDRVRARFPAFDRMAGDVPVAYFDAPGGTQVPASVVDAVGDYLLHHNANTHWPYPTSRETDAIIEDARRAMADLLGATPECIAFGANMTTLTFHVARALGRTWSAGDEIVVTELDHHANVAPWRALARDVGIIVRTAPLTSDRLRVDLDALRALLSSRTRLVAIGAASNAIGTVTPVADVAAMARGVGALTYVDAVHFTPHHRVDVGSLGADFLACSAYKFYGPHVGIVWCRAGLGDALPVPRLEPAPDRMPERLETGTLNHEGIAGVTAAVEFVASLGGVTGNRHARLDAGYRWLHERGELLLAQLWDGLSTVPGLALYGLPPGRARTPTVAFTLGQLPSDAVAAHLAERGVYVSSGDFYATTVVERLGKAEQGLVRVGCGAYSTGAEVDRLVAGVRELARR